MVLELESQDSTDGATTSEIFIFHSDIPSKVMEAFLGLGCASTRVVRDMMEPRSL